MAVVIASSCTWRLVRWSMVRMLLSFPRTHACAICNASCGLAWVRYCSRRIATFFATGGESRPRKWPYIERKQTSIPISSRVWSAGVVRVISPATTTCEMLISGTSFLDLLGYCMIRYLSLFLTIDCCSLRYNVAMPFSPLFMFCLVVRSFCLC